jgi:hypothetical protein
MLRETSDSWRELSRWSDIMSGSEKERLLMERVMKFSQTFDKFSRPKIAAMTYPSNGFAGAQNWVGFCALDGRLRAEISRGFAFEQRAKLTSGMGNLFAQSAQNWRGFFR